MYGHIEEIPSISERKASLERLFFFSSFLVLLMNSRHYNNVILSPCYSHHTNTPAGAESCGKNPSETSEKVLVEKASLSFARAVRFRKCSIMVLLLSKHAAAIRALTHRDRMN